jgi:hypothetical protein
MSCYLRSMHWLFEALDLEYEKFNRKRVDAAIREILGLPAEVHCPEIWSAIKALPEGERNDLVPRVAELLAR